MFLQNKDNYFKDYTVSQAKTWYAFTILLQLNLILVYDTNIQIGNT